MKHSLRCPKCGGTRLWHIEKFRQQSDLQGGTEMCVAITDRMSISYGHTVTGAFDLFACAICGYSELWARDIQNLKPAPEEGVHLIDAGPTMGSPYRG